MASRRVMRRKVGRKAVTAKSFCRKLNQANDVYLTKTKIAVRQVRSDSRGRISSDTTKYYPKTKQNLSCAGKMLGRIRYGR